MQGFQDFLIEDKNTHLEHLEDEIINNGTKGARTAINFLKSVKEMLQGGKGGSTVTVKWDGALLYSVVSIQRMVDSLSALNLYSTNHLK